MSWASIAVAAISAGGAVAGGYLAGRGGGEDADPLAFRQLPDYPEAEGARKEWWKTLQQWQTMPGFGAISPDWADIWERTKKRVSQYYWGGPADTGLAGKVRASAARRGVSQSPALENMLLTMGMAEAGQQKDLSSEIAEREALLSEGGRRNWWASLERLSGLKPNYITSSGTTSAPSYGLGEMVSDISGGIGNLANRYISDKQREDLLRDLLKGKSYEAPTMISDWFGSTEQQGLAERFPNLFKKY